MFQLSPDTETEFEKVCAAWGHAFSLLIYQHCRFLMQWRWPTSTVGRFWMSTLRRCDSQHLRHSSGISGDSDTLEILTTTTEQHIWSSWALYLMTLKPLLMTGMHASSYNEESTFRFVALDLLKNAVVASAGVLPSCQDTGMSPILFYWFSEFWS